MNGESKTQAYRRMRTRYTGHFLSCDHVSLVSDSQYQYIEMARPPDGLGPTGGPKVGVGQRGLTSAIHI